MSWLFQAVGTEQPPEICCHCNERHRTSPNRCWYAICTNCGQQGHAFCCPHCGKTHHDPDHCREAICSYCNKKGHTLAICYNYQCVMSTPCTWCFQTGHLFTDCPERCLNSTDQLHSRYNCPIHLQRIVCFSCGEKGHRAKQCPRYQCKVCLRPGHHEQICHYKCTN